MRPSDWQPIESAPKDQVILLCGFGRLDAVAIAACPKGRD